MKKIVIFLLIILSASLYSLVPISASTDASSNIFRHYMREIMKNYRNVYLSVKEKRYDLTELHLNRIEEYIERVPTVMPASKSDGSKLDRAKFEGGLEKLSKTIEKFRIAYRKEDLESIDDIPREMFNICVECHKDSRLEKMFTVGMRSTIFSEYMHEIKEHYDVALIYAESGDMVFATEPLKIIDEYLSRLKDIFPDEGKTGVVMDRGRIEREIDIARGYNKSVQVNLREGRPIDFSLLKKSINGICIACHEPEKIK